MSERHLKDSEAIQTERLLNADNTRNLFPELSWSPNLGGTPDERSQKIVDIVLHSSEPLNGIVCLRSINVDEETSLDKVYVSTRRRGATTIGVALQAEGFNGGNEVYFVHNASGQSGNFFHYTREQSLNSWSGTPIWEPSV